MTDTLPTHIRSFIAARPRDAEGQRAVFAQLTGPDLAEAARYWLAQCSFWRHQDYRDLGVNLLPTLADRVAGAPGHRDEPADQSRDVGVFKLSELQRQSIRRSRERHAAVVSMDDQTLVGEIRDWIREMPPERVLEPGEPVYDSTYWHAILPEMIDRIAPEPAAAPRTPSRRRPRAA